MSKTQDPSLGVHRVVIHPPQLDDTQPNDGWGTLCVGCKHVFDDDKKYVSMSPAFPCKRLKYTRAGWQWDGATKTYQPPAQIVNLERYIDGTESCSEFESR